MPILKKTTPRPWIPEATKEWQPKEDNKFYRRARWIKVRKAHLMQEPLCRECKKRNIIKAATVVDHITQIRKGGSMYDHNNLQSLCASCHNSKSGRESHK